MKKRRQEPTAELEDNSLRLESSCLDLEQKNSIDKVSAVDKMHLDLRMELANLQILDPENS